MTSVQSFLQTEQKFSDGSVTIDVYNKRFKSYNTELVKPHKTFNWSKIL